jgi:tripartite-type tricarboxylate transporter receptor subunit TctC
MFNSNGMNRLLSVLLFAGMGYLLGIGAQAAETWPTRPVRLVLSFGAPAGAPDMIARLSAPKLSDLWGKQVVVDPRAVSQTALRFSERFRTGHQTR